MRSPAVMSSAPCRWRPRCITAYPSLVRPGGPRGTVQRWNLQDPHCQGTDVGMRCENADDQAHHWCHKTPTVDARCFTRVDHDATHQPRFLKSSEFEISNFKTRHQRRASVVSKNIHIKPRLWHSFSMASGCCECQSCSHLFFCVPAASHPNHLYAHPNGCLLHLSSRIHKPKPKGFLSFHFKSMGVSQKGCVTRLGGRTPLIKYHVQWKPIGSYRHCLRDTTPMHRTVDMHTVQEWKVQSPATLEHAFSLGNVYILLMEEMLHHLGCIKPCK